MKTTNLETLPNTAKISPYLKCACCNWPIVACCVNWDTSRHPESEGWDWFYYCANKACENHAGEGVFQNSPGWVTFRETNK